MDNIYNFCFLLRVSSPVSKTPILIFKSNREYNISSFIQQTCPNPISTLFWDLKHIEHKRQNRQIRQIILIDSDEIPLGI